MMTICPALYHHVPPQRMENDKTLGRRGLVTMSNGNLKRDSRMFCIAWEQPE
jgi:hypothetical protein